MAREREEEEPAAAMPHWPESEFNTAVSFFHHVKAKFAENVYEEFLRLFHRFLTGATPDPRKVKADAYELLIGHPDLVRLLDAFFPAPDPVYAPLTRPRRERRHTAAAAIDDDDANISSAMTYLKQVRRNRIPGLYDRFLALIFQLGSEETETVDANQIYERARAVFGSKDSPLLREFTKYLPVPTERDRDLFLRRRAKKEPSPEEHPATPPKRKTVAVAAHNHPSAAKRTRADDRKTTTNRRANSPDPNNGGFRETWEFETAYTKLVDTIKRTEELLKQYEPTKKDAPVPPRALEELFPDRDCQEVLREMYHEMLAPIRAALEDGKRTELALRTIQRRLDMLERVAVKVAMERRDRDRVEGRMQKLAVDRVLFLRKKAARQSAGSMGPALQLKSERC